MKQVNRIEGEGCFREAARRSRFGHRDWVVYDTPKGPVAERVSAESIKRCLLASGTKRNWALIQGGVPSKGFWRLGINVLALIRRGCWA